jgi:hypothetical protein
MPETQNKKDKLGTPTYLFIGTYQSTIVPSPYEFIELLKLEKYRELGLN